MTPAPAPPSVVAVSVVIPARDARRHLPDCLDGLAAQVGAPPFEVVVVDNRSRDDTASVARRHRSQPRVVAERRIGSYAARNAGVAASRAPVLAFTDADCVPGADWLAAGAAALADADLVGGEIYARHSATPTVWERFDRGTYLRQRQLVEEQGFAATANLFVRRAVIEAVGPFDGALRSSGDYEFVRRAVAAGFRLDYAAAAFVVHQPRTTALATWRLHQRLGAGWHALAGQGKWPGVGADPALRVGFQWVVEMVEADGPPVPRSRLRGVHRFAKAARWVGRLSGRG